MITLAVAFPFVTILVSFFLSSFDKDMEVTCISHKLYIRMLRHPNPHLIHITNSKRPKMLFPHRKNETGGSKNVETYALLDSGSLVMISMAACGGATPAATVAATAAMFEDMNKGNCGTLAWPCWVGWVVGKQVVDDLEHPLHGFHENHWRHHRTRILFTPAQRGAQNKRKTNIPNDCLHAVISFLGYPGRRHD